MLSHNLVQAIFKHALYTTSSSRFLQRRHSWLLHCHATVKTWGHSINPEGPSQYFKLTPCFTWQPANCVIAPFSKYEHRWNWMGLQSGLAFSRFQAIGLFPVHLAVASVTLQPQAGSWLCLWMTASSIRRDEHLHLNRGFGLQLSGLLVFCSYLKKKSHQTPLTTAITTCGEMFSLRGLSCVLKVLKFWSSNWSFSTKFDPDLVSLSVFAACLRPDRLDFFQCILVLLLSFLHLASTLAC